MPVGAVVGRRLASLRVAGISARMRSAQAGWASAAFSSRLCSMSSSSSSVQRRVGSMAGLAAPGDWPLRAASCSWPPARCSAARAWPIRKDRPGSLPGRMRWLAMVPGTLRCSHRRCSGRMASASGKATQGRSKPCSYRAFCTAKPCRSAPLKRSLPSSSMRVVAVAAGAAPGVAQPAVAGVAGVSGAGMPAVDVPAVDVRVVSAGTRWIRV